MYELQVQLGLASVLCMLIFCVFVNLGWVLYSHVLVVFFPCKSPGPDVLLSWLVLGIQFIWIVSFSLLSVSLFIGDSLWLKKLSETL